MTCNQLMVLLDLYRGTWLSIVGTVETDLKRLAAHGLVEFQVVPLWPSRWRITTKGRDHVAMLLKISGEGCA